MHGTFFGTYVVTLFKGVAWPARCGSDGTAWQGRCTCSWVIIVGFGFGGFHASMQLEVLEKQPLRSKAGFSMAKVTEDAWSFEQDVWRSFGSEGMVTNDGFDIIGSWHGR